MLHLDYPCPVCQEWIEILPTTNIKDMKCPHCNERLRLDEDGEFENGMWRDLSKLATYRSHWDENGPIAHSNPNEQP